METKQVRAGRDTILGYVERSSPVDIFGELIWNALDAEAMTVEIAVAIGDLGARLALEVVAAGLLRRD